MSMINELTLQRTDYEEMLVNVFIRLLISLYRLILQKPRRTNHLNMNEMEQAVQ